MSGQLSPLQSDLADSVTIRPCECAHIGNLRKHQLLRDGPGGLGVGEPVQTTATFRGVVLNAKFLGSQRGPSSGNPSSEVGDFALHLA